MRISKVQTRTRKMKLNKSVNWFKVLVPHSLTWFYSVTYPDYHQISLDFLPNFHHLRTFVAKCFIIYALLSQNVSSFTHFCRKIFIIAIYALFPPIFPLLQGLLMPLKTQLKKK